MNEKINLPTWLTALTVAVFTMNLGIFGLFTFFSPESTYEGINAAGEYPVRFFAIRHIAFAVVLLHGLVTKNRTILRAMYTIFLIMSVLDVVTLGVYDYALPFVPELATGVRVLVGALFFTVPMALAVRHLSRDES